MEIRKVGVIGAGAIGAYFLWGMRDLPKEDIEGCYVYACNPNMQKYLKEYIFPANDITMNNK